MCDRSVAITRSSSYFGSFDVRFRIASIGATFCHRLSTSRRSRFSDPRRRFGALSNASTLASASGEPILGDAARRLASSPLFIRRPPFSRGRFHSTDFSSAGKYVRNFTEPTENKGEEVSFFRIDTL
ncbi:MAG: hypothetical protein DMG74_18335 [Acidobacteria bacterium]|nr:MAG: hypothetical protein DMG74_18335 [Acidobacteriota bacterium]